MIALYIRELDIKGGTHKQFYYLADFLLRNNVDFKIITNSVDFKKTYDSFTLLENKIFCIERQTSENNFRKIYFYLNYILKLRKALNGVKIINIHDHGLQLILPFLFNKKIIWQINDLPTEFKSKQNESLFNKLKKIYIKISTKLFVDKVTVNVKKNSYRVKNLMGAKAQVLYCGIEKVNIKRELDSTLLRFKNKKINILTSGVFMPYRNYETAVKVVENLINKGFDVNLQIIGSIELNPEYSNSILNLIINKKLANNIKVLGQVSEKEFLDLHMNADIFMFINIDQSWGLAVFEAMSCGIPVILSESVGATEILEDRKDCVFVDPINDIQISDEIITLINDPKNYSKYYYNGIEFAENYTWDKSYSSNVLRLIEELAN
ncbi:glycosyltransferase family 4 protein [Pedobacter sp. SD-b]|uniref:Glycosyltransferase family 4 protein n=1 Tax=Pedobacter segetis TaxID=2793069 RepID=A0ABS1BMG8_9SPHI|nr:glycosyltransferase family 4 protein [Pedobacter segetis]MBK0384093.1 glycosyltransferase family 4 protein [Pedobacter segetis]